MIDDFWNGIYAFFLDIHKWLVGKKTLTYVFEKLKGIIGLTLISDVFSTFA